MTSPHHHSHPVSAPHAHAHQHAQKLAVVVEAQASWLLHSAARRVFWAVLVCTGVVAALVWATGGQG